jgi:hypothetical protein
MNDPQLLVQQQQIQIHLTQQQQMQLQQQQQLQFFSQVFIATIWQVDH